MENCKSKTAHRGGIANKYIGIYLLHHRFRAGHWPEKAVSNETHRCLPSHAGAAGVMVIVSPAGLLISLKHFKSVENSVA